MKIYFEIFILLLISCSGNHQQQENDIQQTNNQDKKNLAYIIDTNKETTIENKNLQFLIEKDSIFRNSWRQLSEWFDLYYIQDIRRKENPS